MMTTIRDLIKDKSGSVHSIGADDTMLNAVRTMADADVGALIVMRDDQVIGIVSERDFARKVGVPNRRGEDVPVAEAMSPMVLYIKPTQTVEEAMAIMTEREVRHLPVLDGDRLSGMVSMRDLVKEAIAYKDFVISQLEHYIQQ